MIHISELSWTRIKHPSEIVNVGDTVEVYIKDINTETKKIALGFKKAEDNPWEILKNNYEVGSVIDGLIHISQISNERIEKPQDVLKGGQVVKAKITAIDFENKRVSLSMRALLEDGQHAEEETVAETEQTEE